MLKEDDMFKDFAARSPSASMTDEDSNVWLGRGDTQGEPCVFAPHSFSDTHSIYHKPQLVDCVLFQLLT